MSTYRHFLLAVLLALSAGVLATTPAQADDRDLLRDSFGQPYVFILFDISGSMNWSTRCTAAQLAAGACDFQCDTRDCYVPMNGDDPNSKFYQAKAALYEVLEDVNDVAFGFGTYNQDDLEVEGKHWLYSFDETSPVVTLESGRVFPDRGTQQVFGRTFNCRSGSDRGFDNDRPARLADDWERDRVYRCPQLGQDGTQNGGNGQIIYIEDPADGEEYRIQFRDITGETLGSDTFKAQIRVYECENNSCTNYSEWGRVDASYTLISDFLSWDNGDNDTNPRLGYFNQSAASDSDASGTCGGWDPNDDTSDDRINTSYNLRWPTFQHPDPTLRPYMDQGDVIPLSWEDDNRAEILRRLAPNVALGEATPDFRIARYFEDELDSLGRLGLKNPQARPLIPFGSTPLGHSIADFRTWWAGCQQGSCQGRTGWSDLAAQNDPDWGCRRKYLLVITDGDDTCPGRDPCSFTASLRAQENVRTYVVGFGVENTPGNRLNCMAANGGTGDPILPQNRQELVNVLNDIFGEIREEARSFASAAVPSVQAEVSDKIFLSSFTPLDGEAFWDGHLDAFLKPLPLVNGVPDESRACGGGIESRCHLWDAGEVLLTQAPDATDVAGGNLRLGNAENERRVLYPAAKDLATGAIPNQMFLFEPTTNVARLQDLWDGLAINYDLLDLLQPGFPAGSPKALYRDVIHTTLMQKEATIDLPDGGTQDITYVLGDVFHANPVIVENPSNFTFYAADLYGDGTECTDGNPGYRCYVEKHRWRRKMLTVGANDGQLHFFDIGIYDSSTERFSDGSGKELMSFIPRLALPVLEEQATGTRQIFSVDNTTRAIDVFMDPSHSTGSPPDPDDRMWRTVAITGMREGGSKLGGTEITLDNGRPFTSGYFALDITQPDRLNSDNQPANQSIVPTCLSGYNASDCGPVRFGSELWEFTDSVNGSPAEWGTAFDEDENGAADLGETWSVPIIGRVKLLDSSGDPMDRWVAIFGGGFDRANRANPQSGTWLYMVDIETGEAIYKRALDGSVPATPAVIDRNQDGYLDTVYIGTTAGYLYKVDMSVPVELDDTAKAIDLFGIEHDVERITAEEWTPFKIFDTIDENNRRHELFFAPAVLFLSKIDRYALAFGTGDRERLWEFSAREGRFYIIVDEDYTRSDALIGDVPTDQNDYEIVDADAAEAAQGTDYVLSPSSGNARGWVMTLDPDERVVAQPFSLAGVTIFPTFKPQIDVQTIDQNEQVCARTGDSRVFAVLSSNANPILPPEDGLSTSSRSFTVGEALVTPPYAEQRATQNEPDPGGSDPAQQEWEAAVRETLEQLFPANTRFANYTIDVSFIRSDRGVVGPIPIPIGIVQKNWKEF